MMTMLPVSELENQSRTVADCQWPMLCPLWSPAVMATAELEINRWNQQTAAAWPPPTCNGVREEAEDSTGTPGSVEPSRPRSSGLANATVRVAPS